MEQKPEENQHSPQTNDDVNALEQPDATAGSANADNNAEGGKNNPSNIVPGSGEPGVIKKKQKIGQRVTRKIASLNIYLLFFLFVFIVGGLIVIVSWQINSDEQKVPQLTPQELTDEALQEINNNAIKVGDPKQTLNIESNAIFSGQVLVRGSLDIAGALKVGSELNLPGLTVAGTSNFDQIQANGLSVAGNSSIQGALNVQQNLTVAGNGTFGGNISAEQINASRIQLTGDLSVTRHIDTGGGTPGRTNGTALGGGGTTSISGTDTAGTATINTGNSPGVGCLINVTFTAKFNEAPSVIITPVGSPAANINYYVNRTSSGFSICSTNPPPANQNFAFDYVAIE